MGALIRHSRVRSVGWPDSPTTVLSIPHSRFASSSRSSRTSSIADYLLWLRLPESTGARAGAVSHWTAPAGPAHPERWGASSSVRTSRRRWSSLESALRCRRCPLPPAIQSGSRSRQTRAAGTRTSRCRRSGRIRARTGVRDLPPRPKGAQRLFRPVRIPKSDVTASHEM